MAILWLDGFDNYPSGTAETTAKWTDLDASTQVTWPAGYNQGFCLHMANGSGGTQHYSTSWTGVSTIGIGMWFRPGNVPAGDQQLFRLNEGATTHVGVGRDSSGNWGVGRGTTNAPIWTSTKAMQSNVWQHVELIVTINNTTGSVELKIDGNTEINQTTIDTQNGGTGVIDQWSIVRNTSWNWDMDHVYVFDTTGTFANTFMGPSTEIYTLSPNAAGDSSGWTRSGGTANYEMVDEVPSDSDTTYVSDGTTNTQDLYNMADLPSNVGTIHHVETSVWGKNEAAGTGGVILQAKHSTSTNDGSSQNFTTGYVRYLQGFPTNPSTSAQWTKSEVDAAQFGFKVN